MAVAQPVGRTWAPGPLVDRALVAGVLAADVVAQVVARGTSTVASPPLGAGPLAWASASAAVLLLRRTRPILTLVLCGVAAGGAADVVPPGLFTQQTGITVILATYAIGAWSERRVASIAVPVAVLALLVAGAHSDGSDLLAASTIGLAAVALPWMAGRAARSRRRYVEEVERRLAAAVAAQDERARRAVLDERTHIARELHDVVAHHVSLIGVQAGAARSAQPDLPGATRDALLAIEASSRAAVGEMRALLGALRDDDGDGAPLAPQPGLADLDALVGTFRASGLDVALAASAPADLAPALELTCYRIVEEALTNVVRHSGARGASVRVEVDRDEVRVTVDDPGPATAPPGRGRGLLGVAERVALFGGSHRAGPTGSGGFEVAVRLPRRPT